MFMSASSSIAGELLARHGRTGAVAAAGLALAGHVDLFAAVLGALPFLARDAVAEQREVDVEDGVERVLVAVVLDQRRAQHAP